MWSSTPKRVNLIKTFRSERRPEQVGLRDLNRREVAGQVASGFDGAAEVDTNHALGPHLGDDAKVTTHPAPGVEDGRPQDILDA